MGAKAVNIRTAAVLAVVIQPVVCSAQQNAGSAYAMGGVAVSHQEGVTGEESPTWTLSPAVVVRIDFQAEKLELTYSSGWPATGPASTSIQFKCLRGSSRSIEPRAASRGVT